MIDITYKILRNKNEGILAWHDRVRTQIYARDIDYDVPQLGFTYLQLDATTVGNSLFTEQLSAMQKQLKDAGISIVFLVTKHPDVAVGQYLWLLFDDDESAVHAKLIMKIDPTFLMG